MVTDWASSIVHEIPRTNTITMFFIGFEVEEKAIMDIKIMVFFNTGFSNTHNTGIYPFHLRFNVGLNCLWIDSFLIR